MRGSDMAGIEDIADLFSSLFSGGGCDDECDDESGGNQDQGGPQFDFGDFASGIDLDLLMKIAELYNQYRTPDKNTMLLNALALHMKDENKQKIETAKKIAKLMTLLPMIKELGLFEKLKF
jgi:hypothetical protein